MPTHLPPDLLQAAAAPEGGRIVLIVGAGCSFEPPTSIPLAKQCSSDACRQLVNDGILSDGECADPNDLSSLADLIASKPGGQKELVRRLPETKFRNATPNNGHLDSVAMLLEGAISNVITLNFDLALSHALSELNAGAAVSVLKGPEDHHAFSNRNLIYLHRNVDVDAEKWILTTTALNEAWIEGWEQLVATMATATPIVVFAGMGSSCGVLRDSIDRLRKALGTARILFVDPAGAEWSRFAQELGLTESDCIPVGWVEFMKTLSHRLAVEHADKIASACTTITKAEGWPAEDVQGLRDRVVTLGLIGLGKLRASWLGDSVRYLNHSDDTVELLADLLLAVGLIERIEGVRSEVLSNGVIEVTLSDNRRVPLIMASGRGSKRWTSMQEALKQREQYRPQDSSVRRSRRAIVSGVIGSRPEAVSPPESIVDMPEEDSILGDDRSISLWSVDQLRANPALIKEVLA